MEYILRVSINTFNYNNDRIIQSENNITKMHENLQNNFTVENHTLHENNTSY